MARAIGDIVAAEDLARRNARLWFLDRASLRECLLGGDLEAVRLLCVFPDL